MYSLSQNKILLVFLIGLAPQEGDKTQYMYSTFTDNSHILEFNEKARVFIYLFT